MRLSASAEDSAAVAVGLFCGSFDNSVVSLRILWFLCEFCGSLTNYVVPVAGESSQSPQ